MKNYILIALMAVMTAVPAMAHTQKSDTLSNRRFMKMAYRYKNGINTDVNLRKAAAIYSRLARKGDSAAMRELGRMYLSGEGVSADRKLAFSLLWQASKAGDTKAMCLLGDMYRKGFGVRQDFTKAFRCYNAAAKRGSAQGCYGAGYLLYKGFGVKQDYKAAEVYLRKGSERKHPGCDFLLGSYYASDISGTPDYEKAKTHYGKAVKEGHGWTVDITKFGSLDSIRSRNAMRHEMSDGMKWRNKLTKKRDTGETALSPVSLDTLAGTWVGKAYTYDWSNSMVLDEENISLVIEGNGLSSTVRWMKDGETVSVFSPDRDDDGILTMTTLSENYDSYKWITVKAKFGMADGNRLCARVVRRNMKSREQKKPMFLVLQRESGGSAAVSPFRIVNVSLTPLQGSSFRVSIISDVETMAEVNIYSMTGLKVADCGTHPVSKGDNEFMLEANLSKGQYVLKITSKEGKVTQNIIHL